MLIRNIVNQSVSTVYNLKAAKDIKRDIDAQKRNTDDTYTAEIITQVTDIENKKGCLNQLEPKIPI